MQALNLSPSLHSWPFEIVGQGDQVYIKLFGASYLHPSMKAVAAHNRLAIFLAHLQDNTVPLTTELSRGAALIEVLICRGGQKAELFVIYSPGSTTWTFEGNVLSICKFGVSIFTLIGQTVHYQWGHSYKLEFDLGSAWQRHLLEKLLVLMDNPASHAFSKLLKQV